MARETYVSINWFFVDRSKELFNSLPTFQRLFIFIGIYFESSVDWIDVNMRPKHCLETALQMILMPTLTSTGRKGSGVRPST